jgi:hypothetical protein
MKNSGTDIQVDQRNGRRLVLFPLPLQGHVNPMIQLANILHSKGFSITIIHTTFNSPDPSKYPHFTFHSIQEELTETEASTADIIALVSSLNIKCVAPFRDCVSRLLSDVSEDPIACLISDAIFHFTTAVSKGLKLPRIVLRTGGASSFRIFTALPFLKEKGYLPIQGNFFHFLYRLVTPLDTDFESMKSRIKLIHCDMLFINIYFILLSY